MIVRSKVPWSMLGLCAGLGMLPIVVGWVTYQLFEQVLDIAGQR